MSTYTDDNIDDQTGASLISNPDDLNNLLNAYKSNWSATTQPFNFGDYQLWVDTATNILKMRLPDASIISLCNIDTGEFSNVNSATDALMLNNIIPDDVSSSSNVFLRDVDGSITGDLAPGYSVTGEAKELGANGNGLSFLLDGTNYTGYPLAEASQGESLVANFNEYIFYETSLDAIDFKPYRNGTYKVSYANNNSTGSYVLSSSDAPSTLFTNNLVDSAEFSTVISTSNGAYIHLDVSGITASSGRDFRFTNNVCGWSPKWNLGGQYESFKMINNLLL